MEAQVKKPSLLHRFGNFISRKYEFLLFSAILLFSLWQSCHHHRECHLPVFITPAMTPRTVLLGDLCQETQSPELKARCAYTGIINAGFYVYILKPYTLLGGERSWELGSFFATNEVEVYTGELGESILTLYNRQQLYFVGVYYLITDKPLDFEWHHGFSEPGQVERLVAASPDYLLKYSLPEDGML